jgi:hypothetical protein
MFDGMFLWNGKPCAGQDATRELLQRQQEMLDGARAQDPTLTDEMVGAELGYAGAVLGGTVPAALFWYYHCGYREAWNRAEWSDPSMRRSFDDYLKEALEKGWWQGAVQPAPDKPPRVIFEIGGNLLRRQRGGQRMLLQHLWPKARLIVTVDWRMSTHWPLLGHRPARRSALREDQLLLHGARRAEPDAVGSRRSTGRGVPLRVADLPRAGEEAL